MNRRATVAASAGVIAQSPVVPAQAPDSYQDGQERFDPLPTSFQPKIDTEPAFAASARSVDPGAAASSDEGSNPSWTGVPVWCVRYLHRPTAAVGVPAAPGQAYRSPKGVDREMVLSVSAETGQVLTMEIAHADPTPASWPAAPGGNPGTQNRAAVSADQQANSTQITTRTH